MNPNMNKDDWSLEEDQLIIDGPKFGIDLSYHELMKNYSLDLIFEERFDFITCPSLINGRNLKGEYFIL